MKRICSGRLVGYFTLFTGAMILFYTLFSTSIAQGASGVASCDIILETKTFSYRLDSSGKNKAFIDRSTGRDYLQKGTQGTDGVCALAVKDGQALCPTRVSFDKSVLKIEFAGGITANVIVTQQDDHIVFEVESVSGEPDSFTFVNILLSRDGKRTEPFAACCVSLNPCTQVHQLAALHSKLCATCYKRFELKNAKAAIVGVPQRSLLLQHRVPDNEFTRFKQSDGRLDFKPVVYQQHTGRIHSVECPSHRWSVENKLNAQVPQLRIEALMATREYFDARRIDLVNRESCQEMKSGKSAPGMSLTLKATKEKVPATVEPALELIVKNNNKSRKDASWCSLTRLFDKPFDLADRQAIGVWVCGDGNGQVIDFRLETEEGFVNFRSSHIIKIDFTGWRYFVLVEAESSAMSNYDWPKSSGYYVYNHHSKRANDRKIKQFQLWCNNVPANRECRVLLGPVAAIPLLTAKLQSPIIRVNGQDTLFPVTMSPGMYLEMKSKDDCRLYSEMGKELQKVTPVGKLAPLKKGINRLSFTCEKEEWDQMRFRVTVRTEGKPLEDKTSKR